MKLYRIDGQPSPFFAAEEFECHCDRKHGVACPGLPGKKEENYGIDKLLVTILDAIRTDSGPIIVNCGWRCVARNKYVGGVPNSIHMLGKAADIASNVLKPSDMYILAETIFGIMGLGIYDTFIHVDTRPPPKARWDKRSQSTRR